jgi:polysaccharide export outer membrane protein
MKSWISSALLALVASFFVLGCAQIPQARAQEKSQSGEVAPSNDMLNVGDRVRVIFTDIPNPPVLPEMLIPENGELTLHLNHKFVFKGKRRDKLEQEIRDFYIDNGIYRVINVTIEVPARPITVGGEVRIPNTYGHQGQLTILKAIDMAGGFTEFANRRTVRVIRSGKTIKVNCKKALDNPEKFDIPIYPGDKIQVDRGII